MEIQHEHTKKGGRFFIIEADDSNTELVYRMAGTGTLIIDHTEVSESSEGKGVGSQLVAATVDYARMNGLKIVPMCTFAKSVFNKVKEYSDVLA